MPEKPRTPSAAERAASLPLSLLHPKNLALLAIDHADLPANQRYRVAVMQTADWRDPGSTSRSVPDGPASEVGITDADEVESLAARTRLAVETISDAGRQVQP